jgi:hypothetical protein
LTRKKQALDRPQFAGKVDGQRDEYVVEQRINNVRLVKQGF